MWCVDSSVEVDYIYFILIVIVSCVASMLTIVASGIATVAFKVTLAVAIHFAISFVAAIHFATSFVAAINCLYVPWLLCHVFSNSSSRIRLAENYFYW